MTESTILKSDNNHRASFCLEVWGTDYNKIRDTCILAEKLGYDGFLYGESLADIDLDCWTVLSNLSALTNTIKLGPVITYLFPQYRNIVLLAKQALTFQLISNGRLEFRTGAGATTQYATQWWYPYGINYPNNPERVSILEEGIRLIRMLWSSQRSPSPLSLHYTGKHFKINGGTVAFQKNLDLIKPIPVTIAAKKRKTMQVAAKYADVWESSYITPEQFASLNAEFEDIIMAGQQQQKPSNSSNKKKIVKSIELDVIIADSDSDLEYKKRIFAMERGPNVSYQILKHGLVGKPDNIKERLKEYIAAGVDQFILAFHDPFDSRALELFMDKSVQSEYKK
jgi:alkanesulfonate monooxygenase SsuD/methylene tetrahydromethanopterin reductase-like flavin-dependent oxidoreductase (luciferase family)